MRHLAQDASRNKCGEPIRSPDAPAPVLEYRPGDWLRPFAAGVVAEMQQLAGKFPLAAGFAVRPEAVREMDRQYDHPELIHPDGRTLRLLRPGWAPSWPKGGVSCVEPSANGAVRVPSTPTIGVDFRRGAAAVARAIAGRLLPGYAETFKAALELVADHEREGQAHEQAAHRVFSAFGVELTPRLRESARAGRSVGGYVSAEDFARLDVQHSRRVRLEIDLKPARAVRLAAWLASDRAQFPPTNEDATE